MERVPQLRAMRMMIWQVWVEDMTEFYFSRWVWGVRVRPPPLANAKKVDAPLGAKNEQKSVADSSPQ